VELDWKENAEGHWTAVHAATGHVYRIKAENRSYAIERDEDADGKFWRIGRETRFDAAKAEANSLAQHQVDVRALGRRTVSGRDMGATAPRTPWGVTQHIRVYAEGVEFHSTAGHGGFKLDRKRNAQVPEPYRSKGGWYEEDSDWAKVALTFPDLFTPRENVKALETATNWFPDEYERVTGIEIPVNLSFKKQERAFEAAHANDLVAISAISVDGGMVKVTATVGGKRGNGDAREFLVPADEYGKRDYFGFVVDSDRHEELGAQASAMRM
jgi:hypothetical protein